MGRAQFCRICRTENNLKYTTKELKELNKKQLRLVQTAQQSHADNRASKKLLLTTPTLGNICKVCDERIQIYHRLDECGHESCSDVEIDVVNNINETVPVRVDENVQNGDIFQRTPRPETPVIVDDDDMLFNIFMQKLNQKPQLQRHEQNPSLSQQQMEQQFASQFHATYTPPQSTGGSSEGDESKVNDVLTSRESTPACTEHMHPLTSNTNLIDEQGHRIVAIIELDDIDENDTKNYNSFRQTDLCTPVISNASALSYNEKSKFENTCQTNDVEDDEEIVFRKVDTKQENTSPLKKRKRKSYNEKELRLVASLSLVSSDSETEDSPPKVEVPKVSSTDVCKISTIKECFNCNVCDLIYPDLESLSVHERIHQGIKCILCKIGFQQIKRLIHHMRRKHREYNGDVLSEKPRTGQDSCMTIRLRYMQHTTFYECQLCGRIDDVFREHKDHIIERHPNESKSLKDPILKQLKCSICKAKCGTQYLSLCCHLISSHEYQEYKTHLRELVHVSAFGWNAARQHEVAKTAKIFQFVKRKTFFFECKICRKVVAGFPHHLRHANEHQQSADDNKNKVKEAVTIKTSSRPVSLQPSNLNKLCKNLRRDNVSMSMKLRKKNIGKKLTAFTNSTNEKMQTNRIKNTAKKIENNRENSVISKFRTNHTVKICKPTKSFKTKKSEEQLKNSSKQKIQLKNTGEPMDKETEKLPGNVKLAKAKSKKETSKNGIKKFQEKSTKVRDIELKPQVVKVKVKAPLRRIELLKYKCKYCLKKFKGFRLYNLHLLQQHTENEYHKCIKCCKLYTKSNFELHMTQCSLVVSTSKQKRKFSEQNMSENLTEIPEPCVKKVPNKSDVINSAYLDDNYLWLNELLKLKKPLEIQINELSKTALFTKKSTVLQCCYCLHLFANDNDLMEHKQRNHLQNSDILIKYKSFRTQK